MLLWNSKTQIVMKLKNSNGGKTKNLNGDKTQKLKLIQNWETQMWQKKIRRKNTQVVTKLTLLQNSTCDKPPNFNKTQIITKLKMWQNSNYDQTKKL